MLVTAEVQSVARSPESVVREFIAVFMEAWPAADAARVASFFSADATYRNGPLEEVRGRSAIQARFAAFMAVGGRVALELRHLIADGNIVMTERVDHLIGEDRTLSLPVMGICEVHEGLITAWRDYFDLSGLAADTGPEKPGGRLA
jgi:limonene-1,2-epoxide hydrolase